MPCPKCGLSVATCPAGHTHNICICGFCSHCHPNGLCPKKTQDPNELQFAYRNVNKFGHRKPYLAPGKNERDFSEVLIPECPNREHHHIVSTVVEDAAP